MVDSRQIVSLTDIAKIVHQGYKLSVADMKNSTRVLNMYTRICRVVRKELAAGNKDLAKCAKKLGIYQIEGLLLMGYTAALKDENAGVIFIDAEARCERLTLEVFKNNTISIEEMYTGTMH